MGLIRSILIVCGVFITSMFFFPVEFWAVPGINTKIMLAAIALVILLTKMAVKRSFVMDKDFLYLSIIAGIVSFCGVFSVTYNNTDDYAYATYITSFWVWLGAAYTVCQFIRLVHGKLNWKLVINYLTAVCVFQCVIALWMDNNLSVKQFVNSIFIQWDLVFEGNVHRLYGIGAMLDVAGMRFAAVLVMIAFLLANTGIEKRWYEYLLFILSFIIITIAGNMIARTTLVGSIISLAYLAFVTIKQTKQPQYSYLILWRWIVGLLAISIPLIIFSYQTDAKMRKNIRFGFEGFFNYVEKGDFNYSSNDKLRSMYVWPDNVKTWAIGDGFFSNPKKVDPYYTGEIYRGYYKGTDAGYLRFIFYFGLIGLMMFSFFMVKAGLICIRRFQQCKFLFLMLLAVHFIVWAKVASDLFLIFAMFLCIDGERRKEDANDILLITKQNEKVK